MGPRRLLVVLALTFRTDALGLSSGSRELLMQKESQQGAAKVAKHEWHSLLTNAAKAAYRKEVAQGIQETNEKEAAGPAPSGQNDRSGKGKVKAAQSREVAAVLKKAQSAISSFLTAAHVNPKSMKQKREEQKTQSVLGASEWKRLIKLAKGDSKQMWRNKSARQAESDKKARHAREWLKAADIGKITGSSDTVSPTSKPPTARLPGDEPSTSAWSAAAHIAKGVQDGRATYGSYKHKLKSEHAAQQHVDERKARLSRSNWKEIVQLSKEGDSMSPPLASVSAKIGKEGSALQRAVQGLPASGLSSDNSKAAWKFFWQPQK